MIIRRLVLCLWCLAGLPLTASASEGLDFTSGACITGGGDSVATFRCNQPDSVILLNGCFRVPQKISGFYAMDVVVDVVVSAPEIPPFWHLEQKGCNHFGVLLVDGVPDFGCPGVANPWGRNGAAAYSVITAYAPGFGDVQNRGRLFFTVTRPSTDPINLEPDKTYFGFQLQFFNDNATEIGGECRGCGTPVTFRWVSATFYRTPEKTGDPRPAPVVVTKPGTRGSCIRANGAPVGSCAALPDTVGAQGR